MPDTIATADGPSHGAQHRFTIYASADAISFSIGDAYKEVACMARDVTDGTRQVAALTKLRKSVRLRDLQSISEAAAPKIRIGFCGATGTGKSSVIRSITEASDLEGLQGQMCTTASIEPGTHPNRSSARAGVLTEARYRSHYDVH